MLPKSQVEGEAESKNNSHEDQQGHDQLAENPKRHVDVDTNGRKLCQLGSEAQPAKEDSHHLKEFVGMPMVHVTIKEEHTNEGQTNDENLKNIFTA